MRHPRRLPPGDDLIAHWKMDGTSDTTAIDATGNGFDGQLVSGVTRTAGRLGEALTFDGLDGHVEVTGLVYPTAFTIAFWFRVDVASPTENVFLFSHGRPAQPEPGINVWVDTLGQLQTYFRDDTSQVYVA